MSQNLRYSTFRGWLQSFKRLKQPGVHQGCGSFWSMVKTSKLKSFSLLSFKRDHLVDDPTGSTRLLGISEDGSGALISSGAIAAEALQAEVSGAGMSFAFSEALEAVVNFIRFRSLQKKSKEQSERDLCRKEWVKIQEVASLRCSICVLGLYRRLRSFLSLDPIPIGGGVPAALSCHRTDRLLLGRGGRRLKWLWLWVKNTGYPKSPIG